MDEILNTTIKVTCKDGEHIITDEKGSEWKFSFNIDVTTAIASLVYQTIYRHYDRKTWYSDDFEIEFTMKEKNKPDNEHE